MKTLCIDRHFQTDNRMHYQPMHEAETEIYNDIIMGKDYDKLFTLVGCAMIICFPAF